MLYCGVSFEKGEEVGMRKNAIPKNLLQKGMMLADRRYRVDELLGDNGLTVAYKGYDTFRKQEVVVRELFPQVLMQRDFDRDYKVECKRLSDEALFQTMKENMIRKAKKLIRLYPVEGIANVLTYLEERETVYVIEEYIQGQTLEELLWKRHSIKFLPEDLLQYLAPVMDTLSCLHENGLFHGAVFPENIRLTKDKGPILIGCAMPIEDVAAPQLSGIHVRNDAYAPVELYVPEAARGPATDIFEVAAILYRYVTGEALPVYYDRVNEETTATAPTEMMTRVMDFQSEAIMKGVAVYDFDRFSTMRQLKEALCPEDVDFGSLNSEMNVARNTTKKMFGRSYEKTVKKKYFLFVGAIVLLAILMLGPGLKKVGKDVMIDLFYKSFLKKDAAGQFEMLVELSDWQKDLYTNNYTGMDDELTDEQKSAQAQTKYYDFQLKKYITHEKFSTDARYYEYMKIDYWEKEIWISYFTDSSSRQTVISLIPSDDNIYEMRTVDVDERGNVSEKTVSVTYKK